MPRAALVIDANHPKDARVLERWLETWTLHLDYLSENLGCGCCVDMFNVEAPQNALSELPEHLIASKMGK